MTVNDSLVVSVMLATDADEIESVIGLVRTYQHAARAAGRFKGRKHREALDTARICEAMLMEHLIENCASSAVM
jgi:hypothetical protein